MLNKTSNHIEEAIQSLMAYLFYPNSNPEPELRFIKQAFQEKTIEPKLVPSAVYVLVGAISFIETDDDESDKQTFELFKNLTSSDQDDIIVEAIIQSLIAVPENFQFRNYSFAKTLLSKLLVQKNINHIAFKVINENIKDEKGLTDNIIEVAICYILKDNQELPTQVHDLLLSILNRGSISTCIKTLKAITESLEEGKHRNFFLSDFTPIWERARKAIYDPNKENQFMNYDLCKYCAILIARLVFSKPKPLLQLPLIQIPKPLDDLPCDNSFVPFYSENPAKRLAFEIVQEIEHIVLYKGEQYGINEDFLIANQIYTQREIWEYYRQNLLKDFIKY